LKNEIHKGTAELVKRIIRNGIIVHPDVKLRMMCQRLEIILEYESHTKILNIIQSQLYIMSDYDYKGSIPMLQRFMITPHFVERLHTRRNCLR